MLVVVRCVTALFQQPYYHNGVKLMSMGYIRPGESVAVRGPMVSGMIQQMLTMTDWGHLDYLVGSSLLE